MIEREILGGQLVLWWVAGYTRTAPPGDADDRRAEIASDLHDHVSAALRDGASRAAVSASVAGRCVRGMHADLTWRLAVERAPGRARWHLAHPSTVLAGSFGVLVPLALLVDTSRARGGALGWAGVVATPLLLLLCSTVVGVAVVSAAQRLHRPRRPRRVGAVTARRRALNAMSIAWALAGIWRFAPESLSRVSAAAWAVFGLSLLAYVASAGTAIVGRAPDFRKVPS